MVLSRDHDAARNHKIKTHNSSLEWMEQFEKLGTTLRNQNSIQKVIKICLKSRYSVQNLLSSTLLSKNIKIKIYRTIIFPVVFVSVKLGRL
jgi:hypothetical protein